jgi:hypothetical protein
MSTAVLEPIVEQPIAAQQPVSAVVAPAEAAEPQWSDPHPLLPVFIAGAISMVLSIGSIGAFMVWLAVRHSGVMAP